MQFFPHLLPVNTGTVCLGHVTYVDFRKTVFVEMPSCKLLCTTILTFGMQMQIYSEASQCGFFSICDEYELDSTLPPLPTDLSTIYAHYHTTVTGHNSVCCPLTNQ